MEEQADEITATGQSNTQNLTQELFPNVQTARRRNHPIFQDFNTERGPENAPTKEKGREGPVMKRKCVNEKQDQGGIKTTSAMRKPHKTILGIFPVRESQNIEGLQVMMEGTKASQVDHDPIFGPIERANTQDFPQEPSVNEENFLEMPTRQPSPRLGPLLKPAIVAKTGSVHRVAFSHRPHPPPKARSRLKPVKQSRIESAVSISSSLGSVDIPVSRQDDLDLDGDARSSGSSTSVKSVKELMEEAKLLATPDVEKAFLRKKRKDEKKSVTIEKEKPSKKDKKTASSGKSLKPNATDDLKKEEIVLKSTERTVDEIIDSLKNPELPRVSEADRLIHDIMKRVLNRSAAVLGDLAVEEHPEMDLSVNASDAIGESQKDIEEEGDDQPMIMSQTDLQDVANEAPAFIKEALDKLEEKSTGDLAETTNTDRSGSARLSMPRTPLVAKDRPLTVEYRTEDQTLDLTMFYADLAIPKHVSYEDILSVDAHLVPLHPHKVTLTEKGEIERDVSTDGFLTSWVSKESYVKKPKQSVHHFCTAHDVVQLPDHQKGIWRQYHVMNRKKTHPGSGFGKSRAVSGLGEEQLLERVQSEAAARIIEEASLPEDKNLTFEDWKTRSEQIFEESNVGISGQRLNPIESDASFMFWTPAPPKWDLPPAVVKETLFPEYNGALAVDERFGTPQVILEDLEESDEEAEGDLQMEDPEEQLFKERVLGRLHKSAEDLTPFLRAIREGEKKAEEVEEEKTNEESATKSESLWSVPESSVQGSANQTSSAKVRKSGPKGGDLDSISEVALSDDICSTAPPPISFADLKARFSIAAMGRPSSSSKDSQYKMAKSPQDLELLTHPLPKRKNSAPAVLLKDGERLEESILVYEDYTAAMTEIAKQRTALKNILSGKAPPVDEETKPTAKAGTDLNRRAPSVESQPEELAQVDVIDERLPPYQPKVIVVDNNKKESQPSQSELALAAGKAYVILPHKIQRKKKKKGQLEADVARIEAIQKFLDQPPRTLQRSASFQELRKESNKIFTAAKGIKLKRKNSIPSHLDFSNFSRRKGLRNNSSDSEREFARDIWNLWFDERFTQTPVQSESEEESEEEEKETVEIKEPEEKQETTQKVEMRAIDLSPIIEDDVDAANIELIEQEVERLNEAISNSTGQQSAFLLARRGALYRKLGKMKSGLDDLNNCIQLEPLLLDAYWHRHLVLLLQGRKQEAIEDLNFILKHNKNHSEAYRSRASIYKDQGDITMAIINFTQAIKMNPNDHEAFYQRAEMYEKRGEMLLAMEDYAIATKLMPSKTDALFKHGLHYFKNGNWQSAISDLTELLKQDSSDAKARMYRGRAFSKLGQWNKAVQDLSAAIHLNPNDPLSFYYRGCILRKRHQKRALQDFSISLLLDDSEDNILAFLHRGILYNEMGRFEEAIPDFEDCLKLDSDLSVAHVNLGLIYLLKLENYQKAIKKFSQAIKCDPTYLRAYICRAEAYIKANEIRNALLDFTRAIHLRPDVNHFYMYRGQLVLQMGNLDLAAFCVRHAAELNTGLGSSPTQQAIVQTFLKNYDKAIEALHSAVKSKPVASMYSLLGKTQMKAHYWRNAIQSFNTALDTLIEEYVEKTKKPWQPDMNWPAEAADIHFLIGLCRVELQDFLRAHDAFNSAIRVNPKHAEAYYYRGLSRIRLKQAKSIQDFNKALVLNPSLFQAYLSRAAFYGLRGQYTKAILNCNEALKLQPNSVRSFLYRGALKFHIKAYKLAILDLTQATIIDNKCNLAYFNRAICYHKSGQLTKALQDYGVVLLLGDALKLKVFINRGILYIERKDFKNALRDFLGASEFEPRNKRILHTLGLCHQKQGNLRESVQCYTKALSFDPYFLDAYIGRGNTFLEYGNETGITMARHDYERALHLDPCCLPARVNLAYSLQLTNKYMMAWKQFTVAITVNPRFKPALEGRAIINLKMNNTFAAYHDITASIAVAPSAELYTNRGVIHQFMEDKVNAMRDYQKALKLDTTYALAYFNAANVYFQMRQFKQAQAYYDQAVLYNKNDESAILNRAITKVLLKNSKGALQDFERAIELSPQAAHVYFNRANLYASLNELAKAEMDYSQALEIHPDDALVLRQRADARGKMGKREEAIRDYRRAIDLRTKHKRVVPYKVPTEEES